MRRQSRRYNLEIAFMRPPLLKFEKLTPEQGSEWIKLYDSIPEQFSHGLQTLGFTPEQVRAQPSKYLELYVNQKKENPTPLCLFAAMSQKKKMKLLEISI
jgi:hypothetical protein